MEVDRKWCLVYGIGEVEKVFGSCPGESASKEPPRMPHVENVETRGNFSTTGLLLNRSHLLVAVVPADKYLDRVLSNCRGGSGGLCLTHLWKKISIFTSHTHTHTHIYTHRVTTSELYLQSSLALKACDCETLTGRWAHTGECASFARDWMEARKARSGTPSRPQLRLDIPSAAANSHSPFATFTLNHRIC